MGIEKDYLRLFVEDYYREQQRVARINNNTIKFYSSLRGYFRHSIRLTDLKRLDFTSTDYLVWETVLTRIKSSSDVVVSGGLYFRYADYKDLCCESSFYSAKKKFLKLSLFIVTPFRSYYILNPEYVIKVYIDGSITDNENKKE